MTVQQLAIVVAAAIPLLAVSALAADRRLSRKKKKVKGLLSSSSPLKTMEELAAHLVRIVKSR